MRVSLPGKFFTGVQRGLQTVVAGCLVLSLGLGATAQVTKSRATRRTRAVEAPIKSVVTLSRMTAETHAGGTRIRWETNYEADNLGFNIYRVTNGDDGGRVRLNPTIIAGSALMSAQGSPLVAGNGYSWFDPEGTQAGATYVLETIGTDGVRAFQTPFASTTAAPVAGEADAADNAPMLNALSIGQASTLANGGFVETPHDIARSEESDARQRAIADGAAIKIAVRRAGVYQVERAQLVAAGLNSATDVSRLQLFAEGVEQAIKVYTNSENQLAEQGIEFYGTGIDTPYTDTRTYFLIAGNAPGKRITKAVHGNGVGGLRRISRGVGGKAARGFTATVERRDRLYYFTGILNGEAENIYGDIITSTPVTQKLDAPNADANGEVIIDVAVQGLTFVSHQVQVSINGTAVGTLSFYGRANRKARFTLPASVLRANSSNDVVFTSIGGASDVNLVDYTRVTYTHAFRADNNFARFTDAGRSVLRVGGFTNGNIRAFDITRGGEPLEITPGVTSNGNTFTASINPAFAAGGRTLIAFTADRILRPAEVTANTPSNLRAEVSGADYVIVTHRTFTDALAPLVALRQSQGLSVKVVDIEDVYDEYNFGNRAPRALRDFFQNAFANWVTKPRFGLFVGDASYDPRDYSCQFSALTSPASTPTRNCFGQTDFIPTKFYDSPYIETATDDYFVDFDEDSLPSLALGRLPVRTLAEAQALINKIVTYDQNGAQGSAARGYVSVADRPGSDGYSFKQDADAVAQGFSNDVPKHMFVRPFDDSQTAAVRASILESINNGATLVNYIGHGTANRWTGAGLLSNDDAPNLTNANRLSIFVMMTCFNGYFINPDPTNFSLAEALLKAPNGAIAVWASSGETIPTGQHLMNKRFYQSIIGEQGVTIGEATLRAKTTTFDTDVRRSWILFGDPASHAR
ncbi:MAG: C25 family cysteine peptidase [Pyrinomonadaceae bacterium MAG19_C2-C3]|nr:C25 family cysteine peptidase [Pyrinomonadaceae bacterium MAG19_C2-C3]